MLRYIVAIDSYQGDTTCRKQATWQSEGEVNEVGVLYAVISIGNEGAVIVDDGYRSRAEASEAWPEAT